MTLLHVFGTVEIIKTLNIIENRIDNSLINYESEARERLTSLSPVREVEGRCNTVPNWLELPIELTQNILQRLNVVERVKSARVCPLWWHTCKEPIMWRTIDMRGFPFNSTFLKVCKYAVDRSKGEVEDISIQINALLLKNWWQYMLVPHIIVVCGIGRPKMKLNISARQSYGQEKLLSNHFRKNQLLKTRM